MDAAGQTAIPAPDRYAQVAAQLQKLSQYEVSEKRLPGLSLALVDDQQIVWAQGFGFADPDKKSAATAETVYRVGSVSKLFTDIAIMQLLERGQLDLDAPVTKYLPDFHPKNPFGTPITLRELMSHRAVAGAGASRWKLLRQHGTFPRRGGKKPKLDRSRLCSWNAYEVFERRRHGGRVGSRICGAQALRAVFASDPASPAAA